MPRSGQVPEAEEAGEQASLFKISGESFLLVSAGAGQMLDKAPQAALPLDKPAKVILRAYFALSEEEMTPGDVSDVAEPGEVRIKMLEAQVSGLKKQLQENLASPPPLESSAARNEDEEEEDEEELIGDPDLQGHPLLELLKQRRQRNGGGRPLQPAATAVEPAKTPLQAVLLPKAVNTPVAKPWKLKLLEEEHLVDVGGGDSDQIGKLMEAAMRQPQAFDSATLQSLINLEMMKMMKKGGSSSSTDAAGSEESGGGIAGMQSGAKAIKRYVQRRKSMFKDPLAHIQAFVDDTMEDLGVEDGQPWLLTDLSKKVNFGSDHRNLHRMHFMECHVLKLLLAGDSKGAALQAVLNLRALRQARLNDGSWKVAWLLTHLPDPLQPRRFAGSEEDLELVAGYTKAMEELDKRTSPNPWSKEKEGGKGPGKGAEGKKGKE